MEEKLSNFTEKTCNHQPEIPVYLYQIVLVCIMLKILIFYFHVEYPELYLFEYTSTQKWIKNDDLYCILFNIMLLLLLLLLIITIKLNSILVYIYIITKFFGSLDIYSWGLRTQTPEGYQSKTGTNSTRCSAPRYL